MKDIRVRIAPSPTGFAHVGTAYTAAFNYAFARKNKGEFIIRIEDTDRKRHIEGAEKAIFESLSWLGLDWDESTDVGGKYAPYRQSERRGLYNKKVKELLDKDLAYKDEGALRFRNQHESISWNDLIRGEISFPKEEIGDFVIIKSDGFPTYNFAVVVDDIVMKISHVIRGEEHISNTPKQIALYHAFGIKPPYFAHHPTLRNKDRKKLSKRRDPVDLKLFREEGYLPEALLNYLCLLGWSHPEEKETFSLQEFVKLFSLERVRKSGPIFDTNKLDWMNGMYIRKLSDNKLRDVLYKFYGEKYSKDKIKLILPLVKERINKLSEFGTLAGFLLEEKDPEPLIVTSNYSTNVSDFTISKLEKVSEKDWNLEKINKAFDSVIKEVNAKVGNFYMDIRGTIAGSKVTPPINESIVILGKKKTLRRLKKGQKKFKKNKE